MQSGNQNCVICHREGLKWLNKWRLFFTIPYRCSYCRSEYKFFNEPDKGWKFIADLISSLFVVFFWIIIFLIVMLWNQGHGPLMILCTLGGILGIMYFMPVQYQENKLINRIIRKRKALAAKHGKKSKTN